MRRYAPAGRAPVTVEIRGRSAIYLPHEQQMMLDLVSLAESEGGPAPTAVVNDQLALLHAFKAAFPGSYFLDARGEAEYEATHAGAAAIA